MIQWIAPAAVIIVFLQAIGVLDIGMFFAEAPTAELDTATTTD